MMQDMAGKHPIVFVSGPPLVEVGRHRIQMIGEALLGRSRPPPRQHVFVEIETVNHKLRMSGASKSRGELDFHIAIPGSDAEKPRGMTFPQFALPLHRVRKYFGYAPEAHGFEFGPNILVRPVMENRRQTVNRSAVFKDSLLFRQAHLVGDWGERTGLGVV